MKRYQFSTIETECTYDDDDKSIIDQKFHHSYFPNVVQAEQYARDNSRTIEQPFPIHVEKWLQKSRDIGGFTVWENVDDKEPELVSQWWEGRKVE